jgi:hypothetical protein
VLVAVAAIVAIVAITAVAFVATGMAATVRDRAVRAGLTTFGVGVGGVIVVVLALAVGVGVGPVSDSEDDQRATPRSTVTTPPTTEPAPDRPPSAAGHADGRALLHLVASDSSEPPAAVPVLEHLVDRDVLRVRVSGLTPDTGGQVRQCRRTPGGFAACRNHFPIQVAGDGVATFQYQVVSGGPNGCGPDDSCAVLVGPDRGTRAFAYTVFGAPAPSPARLRIEPGGPYEEGQRVEVAASGLPAGAAAGIAYCSPRCGRVQRVRVGADGVGRATVTMRPRCDGRRCSIALVGSGPRDARASVRFVPAPVPDHDAKRIVIGLSGAGATLLLAWWVARRTDWAPPSEAATPDLDAAEL